MREGREGRGEEGEERGEEGDGRGRAESLTP